MSVEPASHLVHLDGYAVAVTANFNNVHWSTPLERGIWDTDHYRYVTILGPDRCQLPNGMRRKPKERPKPPLFLSFGHTSASHCRARRGYIATTRLASGDWSMQHCIVHPVIFPTPRQCVQLACDNFGNCFV